MKCEVMTGGCWAAGRVTAGPQVRVAMVTDWSGDGGNRLLVPIQ